MTKVVSFYKKDGKTRPITQKKPKSNFQGQTKEASWRKSSIDDVKTKGKEKQKSINQLSKKEIDLMVKSGKTRELQQMVWEREKQGKDIALYKRSNIVNALTTTHADGSHGGFISQQRSYPENYIIIMEKKKVIYESHTREEGSKELEKELENL